MSVHDPIAILTQRFQAGIAAAFPQVGGQADALIAPAKNTQFGDFQSNAAMGLGKRLGMPPREVAKAIVAKVDLGDIAEALSEASIAGPGSSTSRCGPTPWAGCSKRWTLQRWGSRRRGRRRR